MTAFIGAGILLLVHVLTLPSVYQYRLWVAYAVALIPFFGVNGVLTGGVTETPVVWYNDAQNLGIRVWTIPLDDFAYNLMLLGMTFTIYEWLRRRREHQTQPAQ
jgi:lycopene cyclase domain-containing protein